MEPSIILNHTHALYDRLVSDGYIIGNDASRDRAAVIVEPRRHEMLPMIIMTTMHHLGEGWNLHVFTASENIEWLRKELNGSSFRATPLDRNSITSTEYSSLLMSECFWDMIPEENVLIFQTDSVLLRRGMNAWVDDPSHGFDYVGANYYNPHHTAPRIGGIQGGLSLRKRSAMLRCIQSVHKNDINRYRFDHGCKQIDDMPEDVYFTHACEILNMNVPDAEKRRAFSIEADYCPHALGHHGLKCRYLTEEQQRELLVANP